SKGHKNPRQSRKRDPLSAYRGSTRRLSLEQLENRLAPSAASLVYAAADDTPLTLLKHGGDIQVVETEAPTVVLASRALADIAGGVRVEGNGHDLTLTIDASLPQVPGGVTFAGGTGTNTLVGPGVDTTWHVDGPGAGDLGGKPYVQFSGVEN